ncbi:MAG: 4Fe-4S dicluster domain-containing protein [Bacteroidetes bacterium]|nr:4Fe-4S dicluster domain-containing protein [Bacteroidota bacterium]
MKLSRRSLLQFGALLGVTIAGGGRSARGGPKNILSDDRMGVLVDTTVCVGYRNCEWACKKAHDMSTLPIETYENRDVLGQFRRPNLESLTVVNEFPSDKPIPIDVKVQCMHCDHPACVSACIVGAFSKTEKGAVIWDSDKCIGCRYCMVACPFQIPAFEYNKPIQPRILKCDFCVHRTANEEKPACVEICPVEALTYGRRHDLVKVARERIRKHPARYVDHIYGEHEVGGTSWLYLAGKDFKKIGFPRNLGNNPAPGVSESIQHGIFAYFMPPALLYALLGSIMWMRRKINHEESASDGKP